MSSQIEAIVAAGRVALNSDGLLVDAQTNEIKYTRDKGEGYREVRVRVGKQRYRVAVHRLVWALGGDTPLDPSMEIDHIDWNPSNNALNNLRQVTPAFNQSHRRPRAAS